MEVTGQIIAILPKTTGQSAKGQWEKQEYVIQIPGKYPKKMCFSIFGADKIANANIQQGGNYLVRFDVDAHEYQGRWFNSINAFAVVPAQQAQQGGYGQQQYGGQPQYGGYQPQQQAYQPVASAPVITQAPVIAQAPPQSGQDNDALPF